MSEENSNIFEYWSVVCSELKKEFGDPVINSWIAPLRFKKYAKNVLYLRAPTAFLKDWVKSNYIAKILEICSEKKIPVKDIEISVGDEKESLSENTEFSQAALQFVEAAEEKDGLGLPLDPDLTFEKFIVGKPNELAYAAAQRVAESDSIVYNPLFLYGGVGLGKTHLMHAIAWRIKERSKGKNIVYISLLSIIGFAEIYICNCIYIGHGWLSVLVHLAISGISVPLILICLFWKSHECQYLVSILKRILDKVRSKTIRR